MELRRTTAWWYVATALLGPLIFWMKIDDWSSSLVEFVVKYELLPFSTVGLLLGATRREEPSGRWLEVIAAGLWCVTCVAVALWHPLVNTVERMGAPLIDAVAMAVGATAVALIGLGAKAIRGVWSKGVIVGGRWFLEAVALCVLALYLARMSLQLYASTRLTLGGGIAAVVQEMTLRVVVFGLVAILLAASVAVATYQGRAQGRGAVEQ